MNILLDNLAATLIGSFLVLAMLTVNTRTHRQLTETVSFHGMMKQSETFIQILRRDMQGMHEALEDSASVGEDFSFWGYEGTSTTPVKIEYKSVLAGTTYDTDAQGNIKEDGSGNPILINVYAINRYVDDVLEGGSADIFTDWTIFCRKLGSEENAAGEDAPRKVSDLNACKRVDVRFEAVPRVGTTSSVARLSWGTIFRPSLL